MPVSDKKSKIILVDDDPNVLYGLKITFEDDYELLTASSCDEAESILKKARDIAVAVLDIKMPGKDGISCGKMIRVTSPDTLLIFHTGYPGEYSEEQIEGEMRPFDYIIKAESMIELKRSVRQAAVLYEAKKNRLSMAEKARLEYGMIGDSPAMLGIYETIEKVSRNGIPVLIMGETGTGKELVARAIHKVRGRKGFVPFLCSRKEPGQVPSELFGHTKGAYTNSEDRIGRVEMAEGGTLFLDEIADLDHDTQTMILRLTGEGTYHKTGETSERTADVHVICATNKNLPELVENEQFRHDLFYRLDGFRIELPPLKDRREDIPQLIEHFRNEISKDNKIPLKYFDPSAVEAMKQYAWPGNVRELYHCIEYLMLSEDSHLIIDENFTRFKQDGKPPVDENPKTLREMIDRYTRERIVEALRNSCGNISDAARTLGEDYGNFYRKIKKYSINPDDYK